MPHVQRKCLIFAALVGITCQVQAAPGYTLMDVYDMALKNDAQLAAARASMKATQEKISQSRALLLPNLNASANTQYNKTTTEVRQNSNIHDDYNSHGWTATLTQPLFNLGSWFTYDQSKLVGSQAESQFAWEQQSLILRVAEAYFNILRSEDNLKTSIAEEKAVKQQLDQAQERYKVGLIAETDVLEARAAYDSARVSKIQAQNQVSVSYESMRTIINVPVSAVGQLKKDMPVNFPSPISSDEWVNKAVGSNLALKAAQAGVEATEQNIKVKKSGHAPTIDAFASYGHTSSNSDSARALTSNGIELTGNGSQTVAGLQITVPIFSGGATSSQVREATYQMEASQQNFDKLLRETSTNTRSQLLTVTSDVERVRARCQGIVSSESALRATQSGYEVGNRNITDVLNAQKNLYAAQRDYLNARYDFIINTLQLKQSAGTLSPEDLIKLNHWITLSKSNNIPNQCLAPSA
ncbi:Outer membrane protein TolC [invertebrate metagenome]|uniref:Outer membrane protein TolC n=1 Tax=invertebrate metagenome TaxID=1711999 RepID=A0A2H9TCR7_9ZZZZ